MIRRHGIVHEILEEGLGHYDDTANLAREAVDLIKADRLTIKILSRSIESLTHQMKEITQVTFERDAYREGMEPQKEIIANIVEERNELRERLKKYEEN
jgi:hypothetical protein